MNAISVGLISHKELSEIIDLSYSQNILLFHGFFPFYLKKQMLKVVFIYLLLFIFIFNKV